MVDPATPRALVTGYMMAAARAGSYNIGGPYLLTGAGASSSATRPTTTTCTRPLLPSPALSRRPHHELVTGGTESPCPASQQHGRHQSRLTCASSTIPPTRPARTASARLPRRGLVAVGATVAVAGLLSVAACSGSGGSNGASSPNHPAASAVPTGGEVHRPEGRRDGPGHEPTVPSAPQSHGSSSSLVSLTAADFGRSQIKTAEIGLRSQTITTVMTQIESVAAGQDGFVASENTVTDVHGRASSSSISIRVPVDNFESAIDDVVKLGQVSSRRDLDPGRHRPGCRRRLSRHERKDSISQLRVLFSHATKLSDIITLESELSDREADLESLLAQQRALTNATTLSTITVQVTRPPRPMTITARPPRQTSPTASSAG